MRDSFIFYRSFMEAAESLPKREKDKLITAIIKYALDDEPVETKGMSSPALGMFKLCQPIIDANTKRYENGKKGGRPKTKTKPNENQNETKTKPNKYVYENKNVYVNKNIKLNKDEEWTGFIPKKPF